MKREINKRLIVSDFDGTLITSEQKIPEEVRSAINEYVACGGVFAVCTGRMLRSILPRVRELGLKGLVVAYQGTVIAEIESGKIIKNGFIGYNDISEICAYIEELGFGMNVYSGDLLFTDIPSDNPYLKRYEEIVDVKAENVSQKLSSFVYARKMDCQKIACLVAPSDRDELYTKLTEKFGGRFDVTCSARELVEVSPFGDTKGAALEFIAAHYATPMSSTVAIGDNLNDLSMVKAASIGVAVGNAAELLKQSADYVTVTNNEGAVAKIIEKFGFKQV